MNFLMVSPSYPPRIFFFAKRLKEAGFAVFGMGDASYSQFNSDLKSSLRYHIRQTLDCYDPNGGILEDKFRPIYKNMVKLKKEFGKLDYVESFN